MRPSRFLLVLLSFAFLAGCGGDSDKTTKPIVPPDDGLPDGTPAADSPTHVMQRFEATWESQVNAQYALLLTEDFRYVFSAAADPELVDRYPNWGKDDEEAAITHLFHGFRNSNGDSIPGASRIDLTLTGVQYGADPDHPDSTTHYQKVIVTALDGMIEVPAQPGSYDPINYHINARHEYFLVRGDAAVLSAGMSPDTNHWYLRRWEDLSPPSYELGKGPVINPATAKTLGSIRSQYRN